MDNDFKTLYNTLRAEQDALKAKMQSAKGDAIKHVQELIDAVSSKGGTTVAALESFARDDFKGAVSRAVGAAVRRAAELSE